jgi:hypothetical protein
MRYDPDYVIELKEAKIPVLFNSWTFKNYSDKIGVELEDIGDMIRSGKVIKSKDLPALLLIAANSYQKFMGIEKSYSEMDAYQWIDELGGFNSARLIDLYKVFVARLFNVSVDAFDVEATTKPEPKKKKTA